MPNAETALEMCARHVREGEQRVARQEEIVLKMDRYDHPEAAARARLILDTMRVTLQMAKADLKRRSGGDTAAPFEWRD